jgi:hypothetical protein
MTELLVYVGCFTLRLARMTFAGRRASEFKPEIGTISSHFLLLDRLLVRVGRSLVILPICSNRNNLRLIA